MSAIVAGSCVFACPAFGQQWVSQDSTVGLSFADASFAGSTYQIQHRMMWVSEAAGSLYALGWFSAPNFIPFYISRTATAVSNCTIEQFSAPSTSNQANYVVRAAAAAVTVHDFTFASRADMQRVTLGESDGLATLSFYSVYRPNLSSPAASLRVVLPGDWTVQGTGTGQLEMVSLDPSWAIQSRWTYDGTSTFLQLSRTSGTAAPELRFVLHGAPVPEPVSATLFVDAGAWSTLGCRRRGAPSY